MVQVVEVESSPARPPGARRRGARRPGARRRSRWQSMCLVVTSVFMACSMGLVATAPPAAALVVAPLAAAAMRVAPSALKAFVKTPAGKVMTPDKWSTRAGLGVALVGGVAGLFIGDRPEDAAVEASEDMEEEAEVTPEDPDADVENVQSMYRNWNVDETSAVWGEWTVLGVQKGPGLRINAECVPGDMGCPSDGIRRMPAKAECYNTTTGEFYSRNIQVELNSPVPYMPTCWRSTGTGPSDFTNDPVQSVMFSFVAKYNNTDGYVRAVRVINPDFDPELAPETGAGPADSITVQRECLGPDGVVVTVSNTLDGSGAIPEVACPEGTENKSVEWVASRSGTDESLGGFDYDWSQYPECAGGACYVQVLVDGQLCRVGVDVCYDWMNVQPKTRVQCEYGPYAVGLEECRDMQYAYRTSQGVTWQDPNPNDPARKTGWVPANPDGTPNVGLLPEYWKPDPNPKPEYEVPPRWQDREQGDPGPKPTPTVQVPFPPRGANPDPNPHGDPPRDPENDNVNCISGMWSWNPVDWVFTPVKCALSWAFIPKPAAAGQITATATATITDAGLGDWLGVPTAVVSTIPEGGGCRGPALTMPEQLGGATYYPLDACDDPMSRYAALSRAVTSVVVVVLGGFVAVNGLSLSLTGYRLVERESKGTVST